MTFFSLYSDVSVQYKCDCDEFCNLNLLYFCQTCQKFNCVYCVNNQIDQYFCRNCMETMVWTDIRKLSYLCKNCYSCPRCLHILNTVSLNDNFHKNDSGITDLYSLICLHCRWSTREAGLNDSSLVADFLPLTSSFVKYNRSLIEFYKIKSEAELSNFMLINTVYSSNRNFLDRMAKNRSTSTLIQRNTFADRSKVSMLPKMVDTPQQNSTNFTQVSVDFPNGIPDSFYSQPFSPSDTLSLEQRVLQTLNQFEFSILLKPQRLKISSKRFKRCRYCQHILCRPDLNVSAIRFKILHFAILLVPVVRVLSFPVKFSDSIFRLPIMVTNPALNSIDIQLVCNESITNSFFKFPKDVIHLSGKEEDHSLDIVDKSINYHNELISNVTGNSVILFLEFSLYEEKKIDFYFTLKFAFKQTIDPSHPNSNKSSNVSIDNSLTLRISMHPPINVSDSIINFASLQKVHEIL